MQGSNENHWVMLMYQLPAKPSNLRVKIWRRIQKLGAVGVRNSAYVLPAEDSHIEDFQWLKREIMDMGGEASVFRANSVDDVENEEIKRLFREARDRDYQAIIESCDHLSSHIDDDVKEDQVTPDRVEKYEGKLKKIAFRFDEIRRNDFFSAPVGAEAEKRIMRLRSYLARVRGSESSVAEISGMDVVDPKTLKGKTWVTRKRLHIDRIGTSWLIRKFVDQNAKFVFVDEGEYVRQEGQLSFDMYAADFGHQGEYCTFETVVMRLGLQEDHSLVEIAEIVHDIDLKDGKFAREEARGIDEVIIGLREICEDDYQLMETGGKVFDALYARMKK